MNRLGMLLSLFAVEGELSACYSRHSWRDQLKQALHGHSKTVGVMMVGFALVLLVGVGCSCCGGFWSGGGLLV